jgi:hypothetical protein
MGDGVAVTDCLQIQRAEVNNNTQLVTAWLWDAETRGSPWCGLAAYQAYPFKLLEFLPHVLHVSGGAADGGAVLWGAKGMDLKWGGFAWLLEVIQGECKSVHVIMDGLEVKATCCRLKGWVDYVHILLMDNS